MHFTLDNNDIYTVLLTAMVIMDIKIFVFLICDNNILFWITLILNNIKQCTANLSFSKLKLCVQ